MPRRAKIRDNGLRPYLFDSLLDLLELRISFLARLCRPLCGGAMPRRAKIKDNRLRPYLFDSLLDLLELRISFLARLCRPMCGGASLAVRRLKTMGFAPNVRLAARSP